MKERRQGGAAVHRFTFVNVVGADDRPALLVEQQSIERKLASKAVAKEPFRKRRIQQMILGSLAIRALYGRGIPVEQLPAYVQRQENS